METRIPRRLAAVVLAAAMLAGAGCGAGHPAPPLSVNAGQPYDIVLGDKVGVVDYALQRVRNRCLADAGYPQNLRAMATRPENPFQSLAIQAHDYGPATEEEARSLGFGQDAPAEPARIVSYDPNYDRALDRCQRRAGDRLGSESQQTLEGYADLVNALLGYRREVTGRLPDDMPAATLRCMKAKGHRVANEGEFLRTPQPVLFGVKFGALDPAPESRWEPNRVPGTVQVGPAIAPRRYHPTPDESALAVSWYRCGLETKRVELMMAAARQLQLQYVERYLDRIGELNPKIEALARSASALVGG